MQDTTDTDVSTDDSPPEHSALPELTPFHAARTRDAHPDRFEKVDLAGATIFHSDDGHDLELAPDRFIVRRDGSDDAHPCRMLRLFGRLWWACSCDGATYHDGPCSHACAVFRAREQGLLTIPRGEVVSMVAEPVESEAQRRADAQPPRSRDAATDGGIRR